MTGQNTPPPSGRMLRASIWVAIGALIAAAIVCVLWVLLGDAEGIVGKAFLTILLLAAFAGIAIIETNLSRERPQWFALASMLAWVAILLVGAFLIWMPMPSLYYGASVGRFFRFVVIVLVIQGVLWHARLLLKAYARLQTTFTTIVTLVTIGLVVILGVMLVLPLMTSEYVTYRPIYWRVVVALAILAAVGTALVPLINALMIPRAPRPLAPRPLAPAPAAYAAPTGYPAPVASAPQPWPTFADAVTPLPALPDGTPDWNAYYTGRPTYPAPAAPAPAAPRTAASAAPPAAPWYQGYPPPPPVPPQQGRPPQG